MSYNIPGVGNHWGDLLLRWRSVGDESRRKDATNLVRAMAIAVVAPANEGLSMPNKGKIWDRQNAHEGRPELDLALSKVARGKYELHRVDNRCEHCGCREGVYNIANILGVGEDPLWIGEYVVQAVWVGLDEEEPKWEPVSTMYDHSPQFIVRALKKLKITKKLIGSPRKKFGMKF